MKPMIGLDIGGTKCAVLLAQVNRGISLIDKIRFDTKPERGLQATLEELYAAIETMMARHGLAAPDVAAIGISCGGPLDSRRGIILNPPNLPGWVNVPLPAMLKERFGIDAYILNDANACALVEWKLGAGRGTRDMVFLTMGTGMGGGIIAEGRLLRGFSDMGGEIGHLRLAPDGPVGFGKAGSFEGFTSGGGIARQVQDFTREKKAQGKPPRWARDDLEEGEMSARMLAEYAAEGDPDAVSLFEQVGTMLGKGIALLVDTLNPERIVIGSIFARCERLLRPSMEAALKEEAIPFSLEGLRVVPAQTGEALGDLASIMVALYAMDIDPFAGETEAAPAVLDHLDRLMQRYPGLSGQRENVLSAYETLKKAFLSGGKLLLCGNGGSCADAQHIAGELMKGFYLPRPLPQDEKRRIRERTKDSLSQAADLLQGALPAIALDGQGPLMTAFLNDVDPELIYAQQVIGLGRPGDVLMGLSTSGNARNVLLAAQTASARGLTTIALTGGDGGALARACDQAIIAPANTPADVQELHLPIYHTLCAMLEQSFFGVTND